MGFQLRGQDSRKALKVLGWCCKGAAFVGREAQGGNSFQTCINAYCHCALSVPILPAAPPSATSAATTSYSSTSAAQMPAHLAEKGR